MHAIIFKTTKGIRQGQLPEQWNELTPKQLLKTLVLTSPGKSSDAAIRLLKMFLGKNKGLLQQLEAEQILGLINCLEWIWDSPLSEPVIPWFELNGQRYLLPDEKLDNSSCQEWMLADEYYMDLLAEPSNQSMDLLVATLCREEDPDQQRALARDDCRMILNSRKEVEERAKKLAQLDEEVKLYVLTYFSGCKKWIHETYQEWLFKKEEEEGQVEPKNITERLGWYSVFQQVAESGLFGTLEDVLIRTKFKDVCLYLITKKEQAEAMKRHSVKTSNHENL